ncbi:DUF6308 family protein [Mycobacterium sp. TY815]|uniref:DUF6308 family protein n=1 Tax=Mycobacterium sp. TY815 TaxID=3050581 RepID=UPI0027422FA1|nr:DUF6308 family protein [Mycobacterium sp. TY815]MDP7706953.1 DUF6308 family protein [Mycobacterium sp. TY815]
MSTSEVIVIAGRERSIEECVAQLRQYPGRTIVDYDLPGPGDPEVLTRAEVARTWVIYSRISEEQLVWFVERATSAPWPPADADLLRAEPNIRNGLYDQLESFYRHFEQDAPTNVARSKISKVLHIKRPAAIPILDSKVTDVYRQLAEQAADRYPRLKYQRAAYWPAIRDDLITNTESEALTRLRAVLGDEGTLGANLHHITDLRLLDMLTWQ